MPWARKKELDLTLGLLLFVTAVLFRFLHQYHQYDDAFITFRYVLNLLAGKGFVYNEGQRVLGTTTPLFTVLLTALGFIFRTQNIPLLANWVNHLADGGSAVVLYFIGRHLWRNRALATLLALFFIGSFHSVFYSSTGMETSFYSFLLLLALERTLRGRMRAAFIVAAVALMTRPDAVLLGAAMLVYRLLVVKKRIRLAEVLPGLALLLPYIAFLFFYFGGLVPQSVIAKTQMWGDGHDLFSLRIPNPYEVMMFWSGFLFKSHSKAILYNILRLIPMIALFGLGCHEIARRSRRLLLLPAFCLFFTAFYAKSGGYLFPWYLIPTVPYLVLTTFAGVKWLGTMLANHMTTFKLTPDQGGVAVCALMLVIQSYVYTDLTPPSAIARTMYPPHTQKLYCEALSKIHPRRTPYSIMAPELGYIGYYRPEARIIDPVGLTNPEVTAFYKKHPMDMPKDLQFVTPAIVEDFQPDYIISVVPFVSPKLEQQPFFKQNYEKVNVPLNASFTVREPIRLYKKRSI